jgi:hypothetical protein
MTSLNLKNIYVDNAWWNIHEYIHTDDCSSIGGFFTSSYGDEAGRAVL